MTTPARRALGTRCLASVLAAASAAALVACAPRRAEEPPRPTGVDATLTVRPVRGGGPEVTAVEVREELRGAAVGARPFSLATPITYAGRAGIADRVEALGVRDATGDVALTVADDPVNRGGFPYYRHWRAARTVTPPVVVTYRMRPVPDVIPGPQFDFIAHDGGLGSGGMELFVLPESLGVATARLRWDLRDLAPGALAASTFGEGDVELREPLEGLMQAFYLVGPLGRSAPADRASGFHGYWLGRPPFDPRREMAWSARAYDYLRRFYRDSTTATYRVFVRAVPAATASLGGTALRHSFMLGTVAARDGGADSSAVAPRETIAHEMGHMWVGGLAEGFGEGGTPWFNEGLNVYYTRLLLLRSGLSPVGDYLRSVNATARAYYTNPYRDAPADSIVRLGFSTGIGAGSAQNVPYTRGSLYFADVDARIRAASGGRRTLDDVILPLFERRRRGERIDAASLVDALVREIGPSARDDFQAAIVRGETLAPASGAFGPCFERRATTYSAQGREAAGYEWVRVPSVPDARCREW